MPRPIIVIGAGIAGLFAGCYGQMNGHKTSIFRATRQAWRALHVLEAEGLRF
ncbi:MAG: hypothetical protein AB1700_07775 [Bacillota bacterium]